MSRLEVKKFFIYPVAVIVTAASLLGIPTLARNWVIDYVDKRHEVIMLHIKYLRYDVQSLLKNQGLPVRHPVESPEDK